MWGLSTHLLAQDIKKDTVYIGIYITSIHDIDFKQKEFATSFWLWMRYRNHKFDFYNNLEIPSAKSVDKSFFTTDTSGGMVYVQMKLQCVMKDSWRIANFPFDEQKLRISFENSQHDSKALVFVPDTAGSISTGALPYAAGKLTAVLFQPVKRHMKRLLDLQMGENNYLNIAPSGCGFPSRETPAVYFGKCFWECMSHS
jgi:hypothetical protein